MSALSKAEYREVISWITSCGYLTLEEWAEDSDYYRTPDEEGGAVWVDEAGRRVDLLEQAFSAMEACR